MVNQRRCAPPSPRRLRRIFAGLAFGGRLLRVLQHELQVIEVERLRTRTVAVAQQTLETLALSSRRRPRHCFAAIYCRSSDAVLS